MLLLVFLSKSVGSLPYNIIDLEVNVVVNWHCIHFFKNGMELGTNKESMHILRKKYSAEENG